MISFAERQAIFDRVLAKVAEVAVAGQKEYAHNEGNALGNFERLAFQLEIPREKVLWTYLVKHLDGILVHINGHKSQREPVDGRIMDAICYLILLQCMVDDDSKRQEAEKRVENIGGEQRKREIHATDGKSDSSYGQTEKQKR